MGNSDARKAEIIAKRMADRRLRREVGTKQEKEDAPEGEFIQVENLSWAGTTQESRKGQKETARLSKDKEVRSRKPLTEKARKRRKLDGRLCTLSRRKAKHLRKYSVKSARPKTVEQEKKPEDKGAEERRSAHWIRPEDN